MQPIWMTVLAAIGLLVLARFANLGADATAMATPSDAPTVPDENFCAPRMPGQVIAADPSNYQHLLTRLEPGDTLRLEPGIYRRLTIAGLNGAPGACITIAGPIAGPRAKIIGENGYNTVSIERSSYLVLRNLVVDSAGIPGTDGIKATRTRSATTHHIILDGNLIIGAGANQQTDGISTKTPTWNWVIRRDTIIGAGTALYLGNSDGSDPFVAGIIENNLVLDPIGYGMEIKYQRERPVLAGMPQAPQSTIIRNNVFT